MKAVGKHFARITENAYARHGAAWAGLLANWSEIAGSPLCHICQLEKITWPGQSGSKIPQSIAATSRQKTGGILTIKVAYGRALEVQHTVPQIIDRINAYYGYGAIAQIKIIQGKIEQPQSSEKQVLAPLDPTRVEKLDQQMGKINDENLRGALHNLAKGILAPKTDT